MTELFTSTPFTLTKPTRSAHIGGLFLIFCASHSLAQVPVPVPVPADTAAATVTPIPAPTDGSWAPGLNVPATLPAIKRWPKLTDRQKQALAPLRDQWDTLTPQQRTKWLNISDTFLQLSDDEQLTMHGRMSEWARLSAKDRNAARFNFNSTRSLSIDDKRAQWEAYQSLPDQDKQQLSSGPKPPIKSAARTTLPANNRLVSPPALPVNTPKGIPLVAPSQPVDPKTLLPKPGSQ